MKYDVANLKLAERGQARILWAERTMDVLRSIKQEFTKKKPLRGVRVAACLHITTETANLLTTLKAGGASVVACASNPLSTQDETAAAIVKYAQIPVFARHGAKRAMYYRHLNSALDSKPHVTIDDGADLVSLLHGKRKDQAKEIWGSLEETTTGVVRLRSLAKSGKLLFPVVAVNDAKTKHFFDNRYGTGQSTLDGIIRATNTLIAGKTVVIAGYGWCGRGTASRARGLGAHVVVTEVDPLKAIEATFDGFPVRPMKDIAPLGDIFITLTGDIHVLRAEHFRVMKHGAILANSGHFDVEIDIPALQKMAKTVTTLRDQVEEYKLPSGRGIVVLSQGRLINLAAAEGHPASVMDMSFANQAFAVQHVVAHHKKLKAEVYTVPEAVDEKVAKLKLDTMGIDIDHLTPEQKSYLAAWEHGT